MEKNKNINKPQFTSAREALKYVREKANEKKASVIENKFNAWLFDINNLDRYINDLNSEKIFDAMSDYFYNNKADKLYNITNIFAKQYKFNIHDAFNVIEIITKNYYANK